MRRVDEAVRAVLSDAIASDLKDPRIGFVTVTGVRTSPDLRHARVFVSVLGDGKTREATLAGLRSAHGYLQRRVADELTLKHTPAITFAYDESVERGMRISKLLGEFSSPSAGGAQSGPEAETSEAPESPEARNPDGGSGA